MKYVVNIDCSPIIFPKLTKQLIMDGENVKIVGKREADNKLAAVLFATAFSDNPLNVPDVMFYNVAEKSWYNINLTAEDEVELWNRGKLVSVIRDTSTLCGNPVFQVLLRNFVMQFSSASLML